MLLKLTKGVVFTTLLFFIPSSLFAAWPGPDPDCPPVVYKSAATVWSGGASPAYTGADYNETTGVITRTGYGNYTPIQNTYYASYYWTGTGWMRSNYSWQYQTQPVTESFATISSIPNSSSYCVPPPPRCPTDEDRGSMYYEGKPAPDILCDDDDCEVVSSGGVSLSMFSAEDDDYLTFLTVQTTGEDCPDDGVAGTAGDPDVSPDPKTCPEYQELVNAACYNKGGVAFFNCDDSTESYATDMTYACNEDYQALTDPGVNSGTPDSLTGSSGAADAVEDPTDPQETTNNWLNVVSENQATIIGQLNDELQGQEDANTLLDNIAENTQIGVDNQHALNTSIEGVGGKLNTTNNTLASIDGTLDGIGENFEGLGDDLDNIEDTLGDIEDLLTVPDDIASTLDSSLQGSLDEVQEDHESDLMGTISDSLDDVEGVSSEDIGFFESLKTTILPPSSSCVPLDLSVRGHELIVGCEYESEVKAVMAYFIYIMTIIIIFQLVRKELVPKSSAG